MYLVQPSAEAGVVELTVRAKGGTSIPASVSLIPPRASRDPKGPTFEPYHKLEMTSPKSTPHMYWS